MTVEPWAVLYERHPQPMWIVDPDRETIRSANAAALQAFAFGSAPPRERPLAELRIRQDVPNLIERWLREPGRTLPASPLAIGAGPFRAGDGPPLHAEVRVSAIPFEGGEALLCMFETVADRGIERVEAEREDSQCRLRALFDSRLVGIVFGKGDGTVLEANDEFLRILGITREELAGRHLNVLEFTPPEQVPLTRDRLREARTGRVPLYEKEFVRKDGTRVPVLVSLAPAPGARDGEGFGLVLDLSERDRALKDLREHEVRLQSMFDNTQDAILLFNNLGYFIDANPAASRLLGYTRDEICHLHMFDMFPDEEMAHVHQIREQVLGSGRAQGEVRRRRKDGTLVDVEYRAVANITPGVHLTVLRDISARKRAEAARREAESRLMAFVDSDVIGIGFWNDGRVLEANDHLLRLIGRTREELQANGISSPDVLPPEQRSRATNALRELEATGRLAPAEWELQRPDGTRVPVLAGGRLLDSSDRGVFYVLDLTSTKRAQEQLEQHRRRIQAIFESSMDAILLFDDDNRYLDVNPAACAMYGYTREELVGKTVHDMLPPEDAERMDAELERLRRHGRWTGVQRRRARDGSIFEVDVHAIANIVPGVHLSVLHDLRERRESERALRNLSGRLLAVQDEERRRVAREIHDSTAQGLVALSIELALIQDSADRLGPGARRALEDARDTVNASLRELRTISYLLHPPQLDDAGLVSALRAYVEGFSKRSEIHVSLQVPEEETRLPHEAETALFRIVQECLSNIHRHSGSPTAQIRLLFDAESVVLEVSDQGHGLQVTAAGGLPVTELGVGIAGMQERVRQLGGRLEIDTGPTGTTVRAVLPRTDSP